MQNPVKILLFLFINAAIALMPSLSLAADEATWDAVFPTAASATVIGGGATAIYGTGVLIANDAIFDEARAQVEGDEFRQNWRRSDSFPMVKITKETAYIKEVKERILAINSEMAVATDRTEILALTKELEITTASLKAAESNLIAAKLELKNKINTRYQEFLDGKGEITAGARRWKNLKLSFAWGTLAGAMVTVPAVATISGLILSDGKPESKNVYLPASAISSSNFKVKKKLAGEEARDSESLASNPAQ